MPIIIKRACQPCQAYSDGTSMVRNMEEFRECSGNTVAIPTPSHIQELEGLEWKKHILNFKKSEYEKDKIYRMKRKISAVPRKGSIF
jgi:hypothetical protein